MKDCSRGINLTQAALLTHSCGDTSGKTLTYLCGYKIKSGQEAWVGGWEELWTARHYKHIFADVIFV